VKDYITPEWEHIQKFNDLDGFDGLWKLKADWFEPPNERRGGWSGVARIELDLPGGDKEVVFLKRQENHTRRTLRNPIFGEPTFACELKNILLLQQAGVPTLDPLYYGQRKINGKRRAILVTRELVGFRSLEETMEEWIKQGWHHSASIRKRLIKALAATTRKMHEHRLVHNAFHPKHVFIRLADGREPDICVIDLEKMRRTITSGQAMRRDLDSLNRRSEAWSSADRLRFIKCYLNLQDLDSRGVDLWRYLAVRYSRFIQKGLNNAG
jgi:hypothetical protein